MQSNFYGTLTPSTPNYTVSTGFVSSVYDAVGKQNITVQSGASLAFLGAIGNNTLTLHGNAAEWQVLRDGSTAIFIHSNGDRIEIPAILDAQTIIFADTSAQLIINTSSQTATVNLGTQTLTTSASALSAWDNTSQVGGTAQAPWSLVMSATVHVNNGSKTSSQAMTFVSDGTAQGSDYLSTALGSGFTTTADLSKAIYWNSNGLYSTDGSLSGTVTLSNTANLQLTPVVLNNQIALLSTANNAPGLVTDGTLAGTQESTLAFGYWNRTVDTQNSVIWTVANSLPYGYELAKISVGNHGLESTLVKDINPGSSSGNPGLNVILPNGKLIFSADDGVHGAEPWVSDGSAAGTFMLADFYGSSGSSSPSQFTAFGTKVAFTANKVLSGSKANSYYGQELAFTDGTVAGTTYLDIYPGSNSSSPTILGVVGNQLYFTATVPNASNVVTQGIYSTDGTTFTRLADITANAALLGWTSSMAYFQATDSLHGSELWAFALDGSSALTLTKDLLSGSGSGLPNSTSAFILNGKLLFNAYTSASAQGFFVSDGSTNGTLQLGESAAINHVTIGNTLIFTDSQGVHAVDLSTALPTAITLATGAYSAPSTGSLQSDSHQAFFVTPTGDLYASDGSLAQTTLLASHVGKFKVLQENALYFIQQTNSTLSLWYSDGTGAGTHYIEDLPTSSLSDYNLDSAVAVRSPGTPAPADITAPSLLAAEVNGALLTLSYADSHSLDSAHAPLASAFILTGTSATVTSVTVNADQKTISLTLSAAVASNDVLSISYTDPSSGNDVNAIQDIAGNDAASIVQRAVSNTTADTLAPVFATASVNGNTLVMTYTDNSALDTSQLPLATAFSLSGTSATVTSVTVNATQKTVSLTLSAEVTSNDVLSLSYTDPSSGNDVNAIQDIAGNDAASITQTSVTNNTVADTVAPSFVAAVVNGALLTLSYTDSHSLDSSHAPLASAFTLTGTSATVTSVTVNAEQKTVSLTLSAAVTSNDVLSLSYTDPSSGNDVNAIQDIAGNDATSIVQRAVSNTTADTLAPVFATASVNGNTLVMTYTDNSALDTSQLPLATAFTLNGTSATVNSVTVNATQKTISLTLSAVVTSNDVLSISYTDPSAGNDVYAIQDIYGNDALSIATQAVVNNTLAKVAWTLLMSSNAGLYSSDGTPDGTGAISSNSSSRYSIHLTVNGDQTKAIYTLPSNYYYGDVYAVTASVFGTDGTTAGTVKLGDNIPVPTPYVFGNTFALLSPSSSTSFITDGTLLGSHTVTTNLSYNQIVDYTAKTLWSANTSAPYGTELYRTVLSDTGATTVMVKDINPGSSSSNPGLNVILPNGKLIFSADDVHGAEPWVSDGSAAGTFMLADLWDSSYNYSPPRQFTAFGTKVAFTALIINPIGSNADSYYGIELAFTDGTVAGTTFLDIYPGGNYSSPTILGVVDNQLYFTATAPNADNVVTQGIYSTDGTTFTRLADIGSGGASLLALTSSMAYFKVSDSAHGEELWSANLTTHSFALVKDILLGSGSALAATSSFSVANQLAFTAYTSDIAQGFFISDGTDSGTVQIGNSLPTSHVTIGNTLVFADSQGVHALSLGNSTPVVKDLTSSVSTLLSNDLDQAFFLTDAKGLYVSDGSVTTQLASNITQYKVVAENAIYAIQDTNGLASLWFSDGTVSGTHAIENLANSASSYDMANAVAIKTVGLWDVPV
jgi:uncharacterized repeat protein (TIGR02059 family)